MNNKRSHRLKIAKDTPCCGYSWSIFPPHMAAADGVIFLVTSTTGPRALLSPLDTQLKAIHIG
jgi:hypothetical protein